MDPAWIIIFYQLYVHFVDTIDEVSDQKLRVGNVIIFR